MQSTIREHRDGGNAGGIFNRYNVIRVSFEHFRVKIGLHSLPDYQIEARSVDIHETSMLIRLPAHPQIWTVVSVDTISK